MTRWVAVAFCLAAGAAWTDAGGTRGLGVAALGLPLSAAAFKLHRAIGRQRAKRTLAGLRTLHPAEFEGEVGRWLRREGWSVELRGGTGDGGIDLVAKRGAETLAVQCKRYTETAAVSAAQVRDLYGAAVASGSTRAALMTTGRVSRAAAAWCEALPSGVRMHLFDAEAVGELAAGQRRIGA